MRALKGGLPLLKKTLAAAAAITMISGAAQAETLIMQSIYAGTLPLLGDTGQELGERVSRLTGGELEIEFNDPGAIVASNEIWDAVSTGAVDAGWYSPGFAQGIIPAAGLFTAVPFGPDVREYTAWWYFGGGEEQWNEIGKRFDIHSELCAVLVPEASGWFREPIETVEDLQGLKMRIFGLGARVLQKLGVQAQSLPPADTMTALRLGTIDFGGNLLPRHRPQPRNEHLRQQLLLPRLAPADLADHLHRQPGGVGRSQRAEEGGDRGSLRRQRDAHHGTRRVPCSLSRWPS